MPSLYIWNQTNADSSDKRFTTTSTSCHPADNIVSQYNAYILVNVAAKIKEFTDKLYQTTQILSNKQQAVETERVVKAELRQNIYRHSNNNNNNNKNKNIYRIYKHLLINVGKTLLHETKTIKHCLQ